MILTITDRERELQAANAELLDEVARLTPLQYRQAPCRNQCEAQAFRIDERNLTTALQAMTQSRDELRTELEKLKAAPITLEQIGMNSFAELWMSYCDKKSECEDLRDEIEQIKSPGAQPVPEGMVLVPIEPTPEMLNAADEALGWPDEDIDTCEIYKAMLEAAKP